MKTIQAVQCVRCKTLIPTNGNYLIVKGAARVNQWWGDREVTKVHLNEDEVFCHSACLIDYLADSIDKGQRP